MQYLILGAGLIGPSVAYGLSILCPKDRVWLIEKDKPRLDRAKWLFKDKAEADIITVKIDDKTPVLDTFRNTSDLTVVSTLPYKMNFGIAKQCVKQGWRYYDLGGHIQTSDNIALMAIDEGSIVPVMTDIGLAPGLVNLIAEYCLSRLENPLGLSMMCGGLPQDPFINELNYGVTFSTEGLTNEYFNDCYILDNGEIKQVEPLGDLVTVTMEGIVYEAFNTSGGVHTTLDSVQSKGVKFCSYKTIRYLGHSKIIRFLRNDVDMTAKQIASLIEEKIGRIAEDKVLIGISIFNGVGAKYLLNYEIKYDDRFTAMQKATGFAAAGIVVQTKDVWDKPLLAYGDVDVEKLVGLIGQKELLPEIQL